MPPALVYGALRLTKGRRAPRTPPCATGGGRRD